MRCKINNRIFLLAMIFSLIILLSACSQKNEKPNEQNKENEKPPESLVQLEQQIDRIIDILDKEGKIPEEGQQGQQQKAPQGQNSQNQSNKGDGKQEQGQEKEQGEGGGGQNQQQESGQTQGSQQGQQGQQQTQTPWQQVDTTIKQIHKTWNEFQPEATKAGVSREIIDSFGNELNVLTNSIAVQNLMTTLIGTNNLGKYIPDFYASYKDKSVDIKRLKFYIRDAMYKSRFDKWEDADSSVKSAKSLLPNIRSQATEDNKKELQALEFAVSDLEKVIASREKSLSQIKANVALGNIKNIQAMMKQDEGDGDSQGGQVQ